MKEQMANKAKLGAFVLAATAALILGLYYIGSKRNIFHSTIDVSANFNNVGGLLPGNNVRFNGINVGTVSEVYAISDTVIRVEFTIDKSSAVYIAKDAVASIGTDGLLGNKVINILPGKKVFSPIENGATLVTLHSIQMDNVLRGLAATNENLEVITGNIKGVSEKFNTENSLWHLLSDTVLAENVKRTAGQVRLTGENAAIISRDLSQVVKNIRSGRGTLGALLVDTTLPGQLSKTMTNILSVSDSLAVMSGTFGYISTTIKKGNGAIGTLLTDTALAHNLSRSAVNINNASGNFNENMEALKYSWPFKKYYRKKKKK